MSRPGAGALRTLILILATMATMATAVACSPAANALPTALPGADGSPPSASGADATGVAGNSLPSGAITDPAEAWAAFAACLRTHGVQVADPEVDDDGNAIWASGGDIKKSITAQIQADCSPIVAAVTDAGGSNDKPRRTYSYESDIAHADCMREHGLVDWPDPDPNDREGHMPPGFDKGDPTVYAGLVACEHLLVETTASPSPAP